jgi:NAD(P)-dependent dehydrogenase (short-subunit alcohol dehydrogenase family)
VAAKVAERGDQVFSLSRTAPEPAFLDTWIKADLGEIDAMSGVVEELARRAGGQLDGIVFNAALADKSKSQWTVAQVERHFRINALGPFALWDSLEGAGLLAAPCNVVLMGSFLQNGNVRQPAYAMSKAALWAWMRSYTMRQDIDDPVTMNMVWPGRVITPANPIRQLPPGDPNNFYPAERVADVVLGFLYQAPGGPRGTVVDLGRS